MIAGQDHDSTNQMGSALLPVELVFSKILYVHSDLEIQNLFFFYFVAQLPHIFEGALYGFKRLTFLPTNDLKLKDDQTCGSKSENLVGSPAKMRRVTVQQILNI